MHHVLQGIKTLFIGRLRCQYGKLPIDCFDDAISIGAITLHSVGTGVFREVDVMPGSSCGVTVLVGPSGYRGQCLTGLKRQQFLDLFLELGCQLLLGEEGDDLVALYAPRIGVDGER